MSRRLPLTLLVLVALAALTAPAATAARGNASAAIGFVEGAQNADGGFGARRDGPSRPDSSAWSAIALLASGRNPRDEWIKGGDSLDDYLVAHRDDFSTTSRLGLLAIVAGASGFGPSHYGDPAARLRGRLTTAEVTRNPRGAALAILGLAAASDDASRQTATAGARALLDAPLADHGWGPGDASDSVTTALVLQAVAATGAADATAPAVSSGIAYLQQAQANDGSIAASIRTDQAYAGGSVSATAFAIQALDALGRPTLRTPTGRTLRQGLTQYQQRTTGGLSSNGSVYDTTFTPSVVETAQAYPAFNGATFPLGPVAARTGGPPRGASTRTAASGRARQVSSGTSATGISGASANTRDQGAFRRATAGRQGTARRGTTDRKGRRATSKNRAARGGTSVSGEVVGATSAPKLASRAGQDPGGMTAQTKAALGLGGVLLAIMALGAVADARRPARDGSRTRATIRRADAVLRAARARGSVAPAAVAVAGALLVLVPVATDMWPRAKAGDRLVAAFTPHMTAERTTRYAADLALLDDAVAEATKVVRARRLSRASPQTAGLADSWPATSRSLHGVIDPLVEQRGNFDAVRALPSLRAFPWLLVGPGALLLLLGIAGAAWPGAWRHARWVAAAAGVLLVCAPAAAGLWERGPQAAALVDALRPVENRTRVVRVQNDFGQVAIVQGAINGELATALRRRGVTRAEFTRRFPAAVRLERGWTRVLSDVTPVLGVMSDNVGRFAAVSALPRFDRFAWLFAGIGGGVLLAVATSVLTSRRRRVPAIARLTPDPEGA